ncbi:hypothetical protein LZ32DRAFT_444586 [Colletotrichum eremochloae]|nr:hypothetical protein LZ32DRAFT_444586 [Colletotrichum eremochloae]
MMVSAAALSLPKTPLSPFRLLPQYILIIRPSSRLRLDCCVFGGLGFFFLFSSIHFITHGAYSTPIRQGIGPSPLTSRQVDKPAGEQDEMMSRKERKWERERERRQARSKARQDKTRQSKAHVQLAAKSTRPNPCRPGVAARQILNDPSPALQITGVS